MCLCAWQAPRGGCIYICLTKYQSRHHAVHCPALQEAHARYKDGSDYLTTMFPVSPLTEEEYV